MSGPTSDETAGPLDPDETDGGDASSSQWLDETEAEIAWRIAGLRIRYCPQCNREFDWDREACDTCDAALRDRSVFAERVADEIFDASTFGTLCERVCPCCNASFNLNVTRCPADGSPLALQRRPGAGSKPEPDPRLMVGKVVGSKWSVKEFISGGGFGWVYRGEGIGLGQRVAIKLLKMNLAASAAHRDLFHSEATILSRLDSPRIVKVVDYGEEGETPYLVMHYLADRPLHKLLRHERLSLREKIEIMRQVALALAEAHGQVTEGDSRPIVHLDLKPEHVFVRRREDELHCTVIDFGLAQMLDATGDGGWSHRIVGTPAYMAGERFDGVVDPRSDIYSFGVMFYELVAGTVPFRSVSLSRIEHAHKNELPPPLRRDASGVKVPRQIRQLIERCMAKRKEDRPQSAGEIARELQDYLKKRRRGLAAVGAAACVALVWLANAFVAPEPDVVKPTIDFELGPESRFKAIDPKTEPRRFYFYEGATLRIRLSETGSFWFEGREGQKRTLSGNAWSDPFPVEDFLSGETKRVTICVIASDPAGNVASRDFVLELVEPPRLIENLVAQNPGGDQESDGEKLVVYTNKPWADSNPFEIRATAVGHGHILLWNAGRKIVDKQPLVKLTEAGHYAASVLMRAGTLACGRSEFEVSLEDAMGNPSPGQVKKLIIEVMAAESRPQVSFGLGKDGNSLVMCITPGRRIRLRTRVCQPFDVAEKIDVPPEIENGTHISGIRNGEYLLMLEGEDQYGLGLNVSLRCFIDTVGARDSMASAKFDGGVGLYTRPFVRDVDGGVQITVPIEHPTPVWVKAWLVNEEEEKELSVIPSERVEGSCTILVPPGLCKSESQKVRVRIDERPEQPQDGERYFPETAKPVEFEIPIYASKREARRAELIEPSKEGRSKPCRPYLTAQVKVPWTAKEVWINGVSADDLSPPGRQPLDDKIFKAEIPTPFQDPSIAIKVTHVREEIKSEVQTEPIEIAEEEVDRIAIRLQGQERTVRFFRGGGEIKEDEGIKEDFFVSEQPVTWAEFAAYASKKKLPVDRTLLEDERNPFARNVSRAEAKGFCEWLGSGLGICLPTDAEWERIALDNEHAQADVLGWRKNLGLGRVLEWIDDEDVTFVLRGSSWKKKTNFEQPLPLPNDERAEDFGFRFVIPLSVWQKLLENEEVRKENQP